MSLPSVSIRQHTRPADCAVSLRSQASIRQHTSCVQCCANAATPANVSKRQHTPAYVVCALLRPCRHTDCAVSVPYLTIRYVRRRQHTRSADCAVSLPSVSIRQHPSAYVSIRQLTVRCPCHTSPYVRMREDRRRELAVGCVYVSMPEAYVSIRQHTSAYELAVGCACVEKRWRSLCQYLSKVSSKVSSRVHACVEKRWRSVCQYLAQ